MAAIIAISVSAITVGCGDDQTAVAVWDFSGSALDFSTRDLAVPTFDFAVPADFRSMCGDDASARFCADTSIDGTCAQTFFAAFADCFRACGPCHQRPTGKASDYVWDDGAYIVNGDPFDPPAFSRYETMPPPTAGTQCLLRKIYSYAVPVLVQFCGPNDHCSDVSVDGSVGNTPVGGQVYDTSTGMFTCSDGTQVNIGPNLGNCVALNELLDPTNCTFP
jgi:hypothetical protein